ncbi:ROK family transcriptional regulator [Arthrobacter sp. N199823]|uniref:ROK family transcriptional regulator n=1 Tax=Arthrobacter sp. N199823 TaxID=2058895 RepID=UPI000CE2D557|nr:ROK family transcriptional regulator [Arthrobacter sp. N199823]
MDQARPAQRGNNLDDVRRNNLAIVLGLAHVRGRVSRAEVTKVTGLNRSTVGGLVAELVDLGLVVEQEPDAASHAGRPSAIIAPRPDIVAIAVNPEVDAVTIGLVSLSGKVLKRIRYDTARVPTPEEVVNIVTAVVAGMRGELERSFRTVGVGVAVPGLVTAEDGEVVVAPHLDWHNVPFSAMLSDALGLPVVSANDASAGITAESTFGSGREANDHIYLNGGASGIGGGIVINGALYPGVSGFAGEFGHSLVNSGGVLCHCGAYGCLDTEVRQSALLAAVSLDAADSEQLESVLVAQFARSEGPDAAVLELVNRQIGFLAESLRGTVNIFNPELVILGGFLGTLYAVAPELLESGVRDRALKGPREDVRFARSELGLDLLMIGAAQLAFAPMLANPASIDKALGKAS